MQYIYHGKNNPLAAQIMYYHKTSIWCTERISGAYEAGMYNEQQQQKKLALFFAVLRMQWTAFFENVKVKDGQMEISFEYWLGKLRSMLNKKLLQADLQII